MGAPLIECIPNISEGQDTILIARCKEVVSSISDVQFLHHDVGYSANRTVFTFIGKPTAVFEAAFQLYKVVQKNKDMRQHQGAHIHIGAVDVCPFVAYQNIEIPKLVEMVWQFGERLSAELGVSGYFYEKASKSDRKLEQIRRGGYINNEKRWHADSPSFQAENYDPKFGFTVVGVRDFLIAYNINLDTKDIELARAIAAKIRTSGLLEGDVRIPGKFPALKAVGWYLKNFDKIQVSTNITNFQLNSIFEVFEHVKFLAEQMNTNVTGSELIGMIPQSFLEKTGAEIQTKYGGDASMDRAAEYLGLSELGKFRISEKVIESVLQA